MEKENHEEGLNEGKEEPIDEGDPKQDPEEKPEEEPEEDLEADSIGERLEFTEEENLKNEAEGLEDESGELMIKKG